MRSAPAHRVKNLVTRDRANPGSQPKAAIPGVSLQVNRQKCLLHNILDIRISER